MIAKLNCPQADGPPMAYFEVTGTDIRFRADSDPVTVRVVYEVIDMFALEEEKLVNEANRQLGLVASWVADEDAPYQRILWCRRRPEVTFEKAIKASKKFAIASRPACWRFYCRFATTPFLPAEIRSQLSFKKEGISRSAATGVEIDQAAYGIAVMRLGELK